MSPMDTSCMKSKSIFSREKKKKNYFECRLLKLLPSMLSINTMYMYVNTQSKANSEAPDLYGHQCIRTLLIESLDTVEDTVDSRYLEFQGTH